MKKVFLSAALALAVAGSWAFYPKADGPTGYMMVINNCAYKQSSLVVINPDGKTEEVAMPFNGIHDSDIANGLLSIQKVTLLKLNSLVTSGWQVISTSTSAPVVGGGFNVAQTVYLLEKKH